MNQPPILIYWTGHSNSRFEEIYSFGEEFKSKFIATDEREKFRA